MQIERSLVQDNCLVRPVIYLHPEVEKILIAKLKDIVKRHQGTIIDKPSEATHIVYRLPPMAREEGMSGRGLFLSCWRGAHYYYDQLIIMVIIVQTQNIHIGNANRC